MPNFACCAVTLGMFDDDKTLGEESEALMAIDTNGEHGHFPEQQRRTYSMWEAAG